MEIGRLSTQVTLKSPPTGEDSLGQPSGSWTTVATVWADIKNLSGLEAIKAGVESAVTKSSVRIRYRADVTAAMRLTRGTTDYNITAVLEDPRKKWLDLVCEAVNAAS